MKPTILAVPDYADGWEDDFAVPTQYSERTMEKLSNRNVSDFARTEIIQMTASKMLNHCKYPSTDQYTVVARKIVTDLLGGKGDTNRTGYVCH